MKASSTRAGDYRDRLNPVMDYIYDHLDEDIGLDRLAQVACLSPYHWHRIYTAKRGETIAVTVKRLRLQRAADRLANTAAHRYLPAAAFGGVNAFHETAA